LKLKSILLSEPALLPLIKRRMSLAVEGIELKVIELAAEPSVTVLTNCI
jgi:hypothetical protein